jgi:hypothetical protein
MTCPSCQQEPLTRSGYIWKPQAMTLTCAHCRTKLRMAPGTMKMAFALVFGLGVSLALLVFLALYFIFARHVVQPTPAVPFLLIAFVLLFSIPGAYFARTILWNKPYVIDAKK